MHDVGVHCVTSIKNSYYCINQEHLLDYYPLLGLDDNSITIIIVISFSAIKQYEEFDKCSI